LDQKHFFFSGDGQTIEVVTPPERTALDTGGDVRVRSAYLLWLFACAFAFVCITSSYLHVDFLTSVLYYL